MIVSAVSVAAGAVVSALLLDLAEDSHGDLAVYHVDKLVHIVLRLGEGGVNRAFGNALIKLGCTLLDSVDNLLIALLLLVLLAESSLLNVVLENELLKLCIVLVLLGGCKTGIPHSEQLIPEEMIAPIQKTKVTYLHGRNPRLHTDEVLVALSMLSIKDENCRKAIDQLPRLEGCQMHSTVMLSDVDRKIFKKLGVGLTCDPVKKIE